MSLVEKVNRYQNNPSTGILIGIIYDMAVILDKIVGEKGSVECLESAEPAKKKKK